MNTKGADMSERSLDGVDFALKKIVNNMAVLESKDKKTIWKWFKGLLKNDLTKKWDHMGDT